MTNDQIINQIKSLVSVWENNTKELENMVDNWVTNEDPCSDPKLQEEQLYKVQQSWNELYEFICLQNNLS